MRLDDLLHTNSIYKQNNNINLIDILKVSLLILINVLFDINA